jgi:hypothetical protein
MFPSQIKNSYQSHNTNDALIGLSNGIKGLKKTNCDDICNKMQTHGMFFNFLKEKRHGSSKWD